MLCAPGCSGDSLLAPEQRQEAAGEKRLGVGRRKAEGRGVLKLQGDVGGGHRHIADRQQHG